MLRRKAQNPASTGTLGKTSVRKRILRDRHQVAIFLTTFRGPHDAAALRLPTLQRHDAVVTLEVGRAHTSWSSKMTTTCDWDPYSLRGEECTVSEFFSLPHLVAFDCQARLSDSDAPERGRYGLRQNRGTSKRPLPGRVEHHVEASQEATL